MESGSKYSILKEERFFLVRPPFCPPGGRSGSAPAMAASFGAERSSRGLFFPLSLGYSICRGGEWKLGRTLCLGGSVETTGIQTPPLSQGRWTRSGRRSVIGFSPPAARLQVQREVGAGRPCRAVLPLEEEVDVRLAGVGGVGAELSPALAPRPGGHLRQRREGQRLVV